MFCWTCGSNPRPSAYQVQAHPIELRHPAKNKMTRAPREDSDQPWHPPSLISLHCAFNGYLAKGPKILHADSKDCAQTGRIPRLIGIFAGCTSHFLGFVVLINSCQEANRSLCRPHRSISRFCHALFLSRVISFMPV